MYPAGKRRQIVTPSPVMAWFWWKVTAHVVRYTSCPLTLRTTTCRLDTSDLSMSCKVSGRSPQMSPQA